MQNEIQSMPHEIGSESDISETIRDQQRELVQTVHNKNKQISDLLRDIEVKYMILILSTAPFIKVVLLFLGSRKRKFCLER